MSLLQSPVPAPPTARQNKEAARKKKEAGHRIRVALAAWAAFLLLGIDRHLWRQLLSSPPRAAAILG